MTSLRPSCSYRYCNVSLDPFLKVLAVDGRKVCQCMHSGRHSGTDTFALPNRYHGKPQAFRVNCFQIKQLLPGRPDGVLRTLSPARQTRDADAHGARAAVSGASRWTSSRVSSSPNARRVAL